MPKSSLGFNPLVPTEAIAYMEGKGLNITYDYDEMMHEAHHRSFTVAKITRTDLLHDMHKAVGEAIKEGVPFETFKKNIKPTLVKKGWYGMQSITNPKTGETKEVYIGSKRLKNILYTNRHVAYTTGRYKQQAGFKTALYLQYQALHHGNRRADHQSKNGVIKHRDDSWWSINYPPNGWGCKCFTTAHSKKELDRKGLKVNNEKLENIAHKDWAYHVGKTDNTLKTYKQKVDDLQKPCKENNAVGKNCHKKFATAVKKDFKQTTRTLQDRAVIYKAVKQLFSKKPKVKVVELCESNLFGESKPVLLSHDTVSSHTHHKEIGAFQYSLIPQMLEGEKRVFVQKENTLVIVTTLSQTYRLALKNIKDKKESFAVSLVYITDLDKELRNLSKFEEQK